MVGPGRNGVTAPKSSGGVASVQLLSQSAVFSASLFIPLFARSLGAGDFEVGAIVSLYGLAGFLSQYIFGRAADVYGVRAFLLAGLLLSAVAAPVQALARDPLQLSAARFLTGFVAGIYPPALLAYVHSTGRGMGRAVSWGSLGWGVGTMVAGLLAAYWRVFAASAALFALAFLAALHLPAARERRVSVPFFPVDVIRANLPVYSALLIRHIGASAIWATLPIYMSQLGASSLDIGALYALNAFAQFLVMYNLDRFPSAPLFLAGLVLSSLTFAVFALVRSVWLFAIPQLMIGVAWSCLYVGGLRFVAERRAEVATSTGLVGSVVSLSGIFGPALGGLVSGASGNYTTMMLLASAMTLLATGIYAHQLARNGIRLTGGG